MRRYCADRCLFSARCQRSLNVDRPFLRKRKLLPVGSISGKFFFFSPFLLDQTSQIGIFSCQGKSIVALVPDQLEISSIGSFFFFSNLFLDNRSFVTRDFTEVFSSSLFSSSRRRKAQAAIRQFSAMMSDEFGFSFRSHSLLREIFR